ncbi:hypothetical protein HHI36_020575 [Cryptolaemus montrouzieri]|uniref:Calcineurin-binding protein cabin-1 n=1 Tax=Cryptolaemus montrouzieri TaxID=559131 RepID=A0ABD2NBB0_9CUCU
MLKIRPLNRDSLSDEDAPVLRKELQEEIALEMYNNALRFEAQEQYKEARGLLFKLINENIPQLENQGGLPKSMSTLKYSCYLNIGNIYVAEKENASALDNYLIASELDETDVTLWYKIGKLALKENRFRQSIYAFSKGLDCNESHWPCLDEIISLLFAVRDTIGCLYYIGKALLLDADYTKGLVFRKQIYKDNPASKEYYQKSNPDYIWEPPLDIELDEHDEEKYLKEVQCIIDRINEAEKALESKPLSTIPLPKALENYSWLAVSKSVISLYQYIQTNEMSFLTFVDLNKCMSQILSTETPDVKTEGETPSEICADVEKSENLVTTKSEEKINVDPVIERRFSQNSEENGTPIQTDNDEEQQTEQDMEEPEEKNEKARARGYKRKRDLLLDLRVWGWHSKRKQVRKTKPDKFYTVEDCLNQMLPSNLLQNKVGDAFTQDDSMNTMDIYNMFLEDRQINILSPIHSPKSSNFEPYFGTDREKEDIIKSWTRAREYCDTCVLLKEFVVGISKLWHIKWPKELIAQYIIAYEMYRELHQLPGLYDPENVFEDIKDETLATILYAELILFSCPKDLEKDRMLHIGQIQFVETMTLLWEEQWGHEYVSVFSRVFWLRAYIYRKEGSNESAVRCLQLIEEVVTEQEKKTEEKFCVVLPNCNKCGFISVEGTTKMLKHLDMIKSVSCLEDLYNREKYKEVAEIVKSTFASDSGCPTYGKVGRPAQLGMLLHALWFTDFDQCFIWSEECLFEAHAFYTRPGPDRIRWESVVEKCLGIMHEIIKHKTRDIIDLLPNKNRARLTETLAKIICKQINTENSSVIPLQTISPWILLHHLLAKNEEEELKEKGTKQNKDEEDDELNEDAVPASLSILFSGHKFLGPKSWCLTNQGELLHFILDVLLDRDDHYKYEKLREKLDIQIEQALFCLYQHPSKKNKISRHLADHNVDPLPLSWEKSFQLYEFYAPEVLPEFNSFKNASITADLEQLLLRITALVIPECDPNVSIPKINEYLQGKTDKIPDPIQFPNKIRAIYYLLGDYYFKLRDFVRCVKYFLMDLAINPHRIDSWACLGLSYFSQLEIKLNFCKKIKSEEEFLEKAKNAHVGFTTALKLSPDDITLWIEFGTFEYMAHSFCSRYLKFESENMSMERFEYLENQKNAFLDSSGQSFEKAIALYETNDNEADERWLQYYILGKIAEKKQTEPSEYLNYYLTASQLLHENNATYPDKINYNSPQHLSVEALELHYRINASILKYLELHEGKEIDYSKGTLFKKTLDALAINRKLAAQRAQKKLEKSNKNKPVEKIEETEKSRTDEVPKTGEVVPQDFGESSKQIKTDEIETKTDVKVENKECAVKLEEQKKIEEQVACLTSQETEINTAESIVVENPDVEVMEIDAEMEKEIKESVDNLLQKVEEMDKEPPLVEVVDEVILLDADYDVIMILSSDEDGDEDNSNSMKEVCASEEGGVDLTIASDKSPKGEDLGNVTATIVENQKDEVLEVDSQQNDIMDVGSQSDDLIKTGNQPVDDIEVGLASVEDSDAGKNVFSDRDGDEVRVDLPIDVSKENIDVQQVLDKMMEETMIASEQQMEMDSDTSILDKSIEVIDCSISEEHKEADKHPVSQKSEENIAESTNTDKVDMKDKGQEKSVTDDDKKISEESSSSSSSSGSSDSSSSSDSDSEEDTSSSSSSSSSDDSSNEIMSNTEILHLVDRCVKGLEQCIIRLPKNYKAIYRLAHIFFNYKARKDMNKSKQLLLGAYKCYETSLVTGLFADRKASNFFNGIWRIPSSEIDRPGSLAAHMSRCVAILLQILRVTNDSKILLDLYFQLKKSPDPDKIYIKDSERSQFSEQALSLCIQAFRNTLKNTDCMNNTAMKKLLHDIYRAYVRIQKHAPEKEPSFGQILEDIYKKFIREKIPDNVNVLDLAIKFCQQTKIVEKQKAIVVPQNISPQNPLVPMGPVLPTPSTINSGNTTILKRPSVSGRPRGRPPLPKAPGQVKPRGKSPSVSIPNQSNWKKSASDQTIAYEYIKHYQEELMKQYNQNLNYMQMAQLSQMYSNPSTFANAYLQAQQTSMMSANFLNQLSGLGMLGSSADKGSAAQMDALQSKFKEMMALVKKGPQLGNFSIDQLMASSSTKSPSNPKKQKPVSSDNSKIVEPPKEAKLTQEKPKETKVMDSSKTDSIQSKASIETTKINVDNVQSKAATQTTKVISITTPPSVISVHKEKKDVPYTSSISSISIIPKEKVSQVKPEGQFMNIGATISKVPMTTSSSKLHSSSSHQSSSLASIETVAKKMVATPPQSTTPVSYSSIIRPPPSPIMPPPSSPLSISSLSPSGGSPSTKLPSPQKSPSPINMKESGNSVPKLNIEAMISRVSPTHIESHKKHPKDRNTPPVTSQLSNFALEAGLPKFPSTLSMTPVNVPSKVMVEPQQSVSLHKLPPKKKDSYLAKLPSSITLTPSVSKSTNLEGYSKSHGDHSVVKHSSQLSPSVPKKHLVSPTVSIKPASSNPNPKFGTETKSVVQTDFPKSLKGMPIPTPRKPDNLTHTPFNIESMLQMSSKPRVSSSSLLTYSYPQPPTQKVAHTSVITSTNMSPSAGHKVAMDRKIPTTFRHANPMVVGRNSSKVGHSDVKSINVSGVSNKKNDPRSSSQLYQDMPLPMSSTYSMPRHDKKTLIQRASKGSPTPVISTIPRTSPTSVYIAPPPSTSPGKTLQEKLADKKREQANKQLFQLKEQQKVPQQQQPSRDPSTSFANPHPISKMLSNPKGSEADKSKDTGWTESPYNQRYFM